MDLLQGLFGTAIQFKFHDVNVIVSFQHEIHTSLGSVILDFRVKTYQLEDDKKHVLIMTFLFTDQLVRSIGQKTFQSIEKGIQLPCLDLVDKFLNFKWSLNFVEPGLKRHQKIDKTFLHLFVWESKAIKSKAFIIAFYREVPTLEDHGNRLFVPVNAIQYV